MLVSAEELIRDAHREGYALGAFNTYNLEMTNAIVRAAEQERAPIFLQLGSGQLKYGQFAPLVALCRAAAEKANVPIALHLDHGAAMAEIQRALAAGFTSVMVDGSRLPFEQNVAMTRRVVALAQRYGVPVEAELGRLSGSEDAAAVVAPQGEMTDPEQAQAFVEATGVDLLAVCIGNVHGFYAGEPHLDFERLCEICRRLSVPLVRMSVPLVIHGTSGIPDETIRALIANGVVKFNLNTELRVAYFNTLSQEIARRDDTFNLARLMNPVMEAVTQVVTAKLQLFGSANKLTHPTPLKVQETHSIH
ncbi:MAG TPA: class II fructose-bisphosphate aldolase [Anaerolineae bacterium]|nr:class II fructose-bisphosphate aldolase [Anaerolineae bacterium]